MYDQDGRVVGRKNHGRTKKSWRRKIESKSYTTKPHPLFFGCAFSWFYFFLHFVTNKNVKKTGNVQKWKRQCSEEGTHQMQSNAQLLLLALQQKHQEWSREWKCKWVHTEQTNEGLVKWTKDMNTLYEKK